MNNITYKAFEIICAIIIIYLIMCNIMFSFNHPNLNQFQLFRHPIEFLLWDRVNGGENE